MRRKKKGNAVLEGLTILVILFVMALVSIFGYQVFDEANTEIQSEIDMPEAKAISSDLYGKYPELMDNLILFAFVLLIAFTLVSVFMLDTHPIFFIVTIILLIGLFLVATILGNTFDDIMQTDELSTFANAFSYTSWIFTHIVQTMIATGFLITIALFVKFRMG